MSPHLVCKGIVDLHSGSISVTSPGEGSGATFTVDLPLLRKRIRSSGGISNHDDVEQKRSEVGEAAPGTSPASIYLSYRESGAFRMRSLRVLVVDDSALNRKMMCCILRSRCGLIEEAADGEEAVERVGEALLHRQPYDVVLMDNQMPKMNGPEATLEMRHGLGYTGTIIGVTGCATPEEVEQFRSQGANHVLQKPVDMSVLDLLLRGWLEFLLMFLLEACRLMTLK